VTSDAKPLTVRIIGAGRAGRSLAKALEDSARFAVRDVLGRTDHDRMLASDSADVVVIATPDSVIAEVARTLPRSTETVVVHLAGSLGLDVLAPHPRRAAMHPLMALPNPELGAARLRDGGWFATAGDPVAREMVAALGGRPFEIGDEDRALYHAAAVISSNHVVALLGHGERVGNEAKVPFEALLDLASGNLANVASMGPAAALTGPAARGDEATLDAHLGALRRRLPAELATYSALLNEARLLADRHEPAPATAGPRIVATIDELRGTLFDHRRAGRRVGFVPTMGYLHAGHVSLIEASARANDVTVVSIFVNPLQFGADEDLGDYPRDLDRDLELCAAANADVVFVPSVAEMYPEDIDTVVSVPTVAGPLEGAARPNHFAGVATVVAKLFAIVGDCRAYFGEKDWQQVAVVRRMVSDLSMPVEVLACPTRRELDGLAMSSRNEYLTEAERRQAPVLRKALDAGIGLIQDGERDPATVEARMAEVIATAPLAVLDYAAAVCADTLEHSGALAGEIRLLLAVKFGRARLIDNDGCLA